MTATIFQDNYSPRRVYWASQESTSDFEPTAQNTGGSFDLATDGVLICGRATKGETLLWTTSDVWAMRYIGGTLVYSFTRVGSNCGIIGPNAVVVLDSGAFWMGTGRFHLYDGFTKTLDCDVTDYVFGDFSSANASKVWAFANPQFGEVTWFYPSGQSSSCDRYVTFNYQEGHWSFGELARSIGVTKRAGATVPVPVMVGSDGTIYDHETGNVRTGSTASLESGPIELGDGDQVMRVQQIVPDDETLGNVDLYLITSMYPDEAEVEHGPYTAENNTSVRVTARQVRLKVVEADETDWRVGVIRLGVIPGGRR